jgi:hypothetical protein
MRRLDSIRSWLRGAFVGALGLGAMAACSSSSAPPALQGCHGDAGCNTGSGGGGSGGGGSSGGDDASTGACGASESASQCDQCANGKCCSELTDCGTDTSCENLLNCWDDCGTTACQSACKTQYSGAPLALFEKLLSCIATDCPVCAQLGTGDPCSTSSGSTACNPLLSCGGEWCTKPCSKNSDCGGLGAGGGNFTGNPNVCRHVAAGDYCFPGCASNADCGDFPNTYCLQTTDLQNDTVLVCADGPDGGL